MTQHAGGHVPVDADTSARANRGWWDGEAEAYYAEHGRFLGDNDLVWGPERLIEASARLLGDLTGLDVLEVGAGAAQGARYVAHQGARVIASDLSGGMLAQAARIGRSVPLVQCDARALPFPDQAFDVAFSAYGALPFVADVETVLAEICRVLRPSGRFVASVTHPVRWAFPDEPGPDGLVASGSYFDRTPYVEVDETGEVTYVEHHRTTGDWVRALVRCGFVIDDLVEPEWPATLAEVWGGWSPLRGRALPGTLVLVAHRR